MTEWKEIPYYPVGRGGVPVVEAEPASVYHFASLLPGTIWAWEVKIHERRKRGSERHGMMIFRRGEVVFSSSIPRHVTVDVMKHHAMAFIDAYNALQGLSA